jgi:chemotaxis protein MotB
MPRLRQIIGLGVLGAALTGCVPAEQYAGMKMKADQLAEQLGHSQSEVNEIAAQRDAAKQQLAALNNNGQSTSGIIASLTAANTELQKANDDWAAKYAAVMQQYGSIQTASNSGASALPPPLTNQLTAFAAQYPDLVEFDKARGMVKFKSDVTFSPGDATVSSKAKEVLGRFASILNAAGTGGYDLLVAGHTDNMKVTSETAKQHGHFNNWYLSAHRAIAVGSELQQDGVSPKRMGVVGYADERPIASNSTDAGRTLNRRVEVLILPSVSTASNPVAFADEAPIAPAPRHRAAAPVAPAAPASARMTGTK